MWCSPAFRTAVLNLLITGDAKVSPTQCIFGLLESVFYPGSKAILITHCLQRDGRSTHHHKTGRIICPGVGVRGQQPILLAVTLAVNHPRQVAGFGAAIAQGALALLPRRLSDRLRLR